MSECHFANGLSTRDALSMDPWCHTHQRSASLCQREAAAQLDALTAELETVSQCNAANILELSRADERIGALTAERDQMGANAERFRQSMYAVEEQATKLRAELARCNDRVAWLESAVERVLTERQRIAEGATDPREDAFRRGWAEGILGTVCDVRAAIAPEKRP